MLRFAPVHYLTPRGFFRRAVELALASSSLSLAGVSFVHWQRAYRRIIDNPAAAIDKAKALALQCLEIDPSEPQGHWALGRAFLLLQDLSGWIDELRTVVSVNPNSVMSLYPLARSLTFAGELEQSTSVVREARSLSPFDPILFATTSLDAMNHSMLGAMRKRPA